MILQHTKVIPLLYVVYLPGNRDPSWEQCSHAPNTFQALPRSVSRPPCNLTMHPVSVTKGSRRVLKGTSISQDCTKGLGRVPKVVINNVSGLFHS